MTVHLGKDSAYAAFALVELATRGVGTQVALADLAESTGIAADGLSLIFAKLANSDIVRQEGKSPERFTLSRPAERITLLDVVEAIEGPAPPDLLLPKHTGTAKAPASDDASQSDSDQAEARPPAWKDKFDVTAVPTLAADLLSSSTIQDLVNAQRAPTTDGWLCQ
ncbi:MAG: Rrf2 family transcriptional regulator [Phycisphaerae bacterium]|jgi:DNA-binding IscR family transcriptional regulator